MLPQTGEDEDVRHSSVKRRRVERQGEGEEEEEGRATEASITGAPGVTLAAEQQKSHFRSKRCVSERCVCLKAEKKKN